MRTKEFIAEIKKMFGCDSVRISRPLGRMFLIIGFNKNTADNEGQWYRNGEPIDFEYLEEQVIANGVCLDELLANAQHYKKLLDTDWTKPENWKRYIKELKTQKG
jgi:hypothetical protein